jgi:hypothetical protein
MAEAAAHLTDSVIPSVPVRQWVLSVPKRLRPQLARDPTLSSAGLRILLRAIRAELLAASGPGPPDKARIGAISFLHRFGSGLNPHPHVHLAVTDGLFVRGFGDPDNPLQFHPARPFDAERARGLTPIFPRRILRLDVRRGRLSDADARDMLVWRGTGGFSLNGSVRTAAHDRSGLERLLPYCARPPFALYRLRSTSGSLASPDARLIFTLPRADRTGRTAIQLSAIELLQRLAPPIPPPRLHRHRYHGVVAPNSRLRREVTRYGRELNANPDGEPDEGLNIDSGEDPAVQSRAHLDRGRGARRRRAD